jgi:hypothetical protein
VRPDDIRYRLEYYEQEHKSGRLGLGAYEAVKRALEYALEHDIRDIPCGEVAKRFDETAERSRRRFFWTMMFGVVLHGTALFETSAELQVFLGRAALCVPLLIFVWIARSFSQKPFEKFTHWLNRTDFVLLREYEENAKRSAREEQSQGSDAGEAFEAPWDRVAAEVDWR